MCIHKYNRPESFSFVNFLSCITRDGIYVFYRDNEPIHSETELIIY